MAVIANISLDIMCDCGFSFGFETNDVSGIISTDRWDCELCGFHGIESIFIGERCPNCFRAIDDVVLSEY
jgi:hypothetical protein